MSRLTENSTPAERARKCTFAERFDSAANLALNGGVISGSATWVSNGLQINNTTSYVNYSTRYPAFNTSLTAYCGYVEFTPSFALDDGLTHYLVTTGQYSVYKTTTGSIRLRGGSGSIYIFISDSASVTANWKAGQKNRLAWSCVSGANYVYLNGVLLTATYNTAWSAVAGSSLAIGASSDSFTGIMHECKLFTYSTSAQALTQKDCEVLSAGTTYTYWGSATCIMNGLSAQYDIANYRHLDISGCGNHVLLGNGAGTGTPTKLAAQGYSFSSGSSHYMTVPLAAWPGQAGTILMDCNIDTSDSTVRLMGTDHTSGANYESRTQVGSSKLQFVLGCNGTLYTADMTNPDVRYGKHIIGVTWNGNTKGYWDGRLVGSASTGTVTTPNTAWWIMRYDSYLTGTLRSFVSFSKELSSIQVVDATLWMRNLRNRV